MRQLLHHPFVDCPSSILRQRQVAALEAHLRFLREKQEAFNRRIEEYIQALRVLIAVEKKKVTTEARRHGDRTEMTD